MRMVRLMIVVSVAVILFTYPLNAQWVCVNGPFGATVTNSVAISGPNILAGSPNGVFISSDFGSNWAASNAGLTNINVTCLGASPADSIDNKVFAGTLGGGVFVSTNNGAEWSDVSGGLADLNVHCLAVDGGHLFAGTDSGVSHSTDGGASWHPVNSGLTEMVVLALTISGNSLFAGTISGKTFHSVVGSFIWTVGNPGITGIVLKAIVATTTRLLMGTSTYQLSMSTIVPGGIYSSSDSGNNWTKILSGPTVYSFMIENERIYAGTSQGVLLSTNNGDAWSLLSPGLANKQVYALAASDERFIASTDDGVFVSMDTGSTWTTDMLPSTKGITALCVYPDGRGGKYLVVGTSGNGVFLSSDEGNKWTDINNGLTNWTIWSVVYNVQDSSLFAASYGGGVYRSTTNGASWTAVNNGLTNLDIWSLGANGPNIYAATFGSGLFRSDDNGDSWTPVNNGMPKATFDTTRYMLTDVVFGDGPNLYAGTGTAGGAYRSVDDGAKWTPIGLKDHDVEAYATSGDKLFAGTAGGVFLSTNNGDDWVASNDGLTGLDARALVVSAGYLFAGMSAGGGGTGGVYSTTDDVMNWVPRNDGLAYPAERFVMKLALSDDYIYASSLGLLFRRTLSDLTSIENDSIQTPTEYHLSQNYPNPFNPSTTISFTIPSRSIVTLKLFDILGREVAEILHQDLMRGEHSYQWTAVGVTSGVYYYRLQVGSNTVTKKLLLLR